MSKKLQHISENSSFNWFISSESLQTRFDNTPRHSDDIQKRINRVLRRVEVYNARLLPCMATGKTFVDLNGLFAQWFSPRIDVSLREPHERCTESRIPKLLLRRCKRHDAVVL